MSRVYREKGLGWLYSQNYSERPLVVDEQNNETLLKLQYRTSIPTAKDLHRWCTPVRDQGPPFSSSIQAVIAMVELTQNRNFGKYVKGSARFGYKVGRNLLHIKGDRGMYVRTGSASHMLFGMAPEEYWPDTTDDWNEYEREPTAFVYALAQNYKMTSCTRIDRPGMSCELLLTYIKCYIADGFGASFGFPIYESITRAQETGKIPFPGPTEQSVAGHCVMAMGYDDNLQIVNDSAGNKTVGAIIIKNSWGTEWGDQGYGYLPYEYILKGLAKDWWVALDANFVDLEQFGLPPTLQGDNSSPVQDVSTADVLHDTVKARFGDRPGGYNPSNINKSRSKKSDQDRESERTGEAK